MGNFSKRQMSLSSWFMASSRLFLKAFFDMVSMMRGRRWYSSCRASHFFFRCCRRETWRESTTCHQTNTENESSRIQEWQTDLFNLSSESEEFLNDSSTGITRHQTYLQGGLPLFLRQLLHGLLLLLLLLHSGVLLLRPPLRLTAPLQVRRHFPIILQSHTFRAGQMWNPAQALASGQRFWACEGLTAPLHWRIVQKWKNPSESITKMIMEWLNRRFFF